MQNSQSVTITPTPEEQDVLLHVLDAFPDYKSATRLLCKFKFFFPNQSGDLCRSSDQSPDAVGQESINSVSPFVGLTFKSVRQGGNQ